ncbi:hypothetical protein [Thermococcus sp. JCM 11816]|uniref:hypothetical protein n=1 Tax=Thermococcus sp. (strain JCM 11816 / KS-1) TaxID=1295125 RepID=UPI0006D05796
MRKVLIVLTVILIGLIGAFLGYRYVGPPGPGEVERIIQSPPGVIDPATARLYTTIKAGVDFLECGDRHRAPLDIREPLQEGPLRVHSRPYGGHLRPACVRRDCQPPLFHRLVGGHTRAIGPGPVLVVPDFFIALALAVLLYLALK